MPRPEPDDTTGLLSRLVALPFWVYPIVLVVLYFTVEILASAGALPREWGAALQVYVRDIN